MRVMPAVNCAALLSGPRMGCFVLSGSYFSVRTMYGWAGSRGGFFPVVKLFFSDDDRKRESFI